MKKQPASPYFSVSRGRPAHAAGDFEVSELKNGPALLRFAFSLGKVQVHLEQQTNVRIGAEAEAKNFRRRTGEALRIEGNLQAS